MPDSKRVDRDRVIILASVLALLAISTLFVAFGYPGFTLLSSALVVSLLLGIYWKLSDLLEIRALGMTKEELEAIKNRR